MERPGPPGGVVVEIATRQMLTPRGWGMWAMQVRDARRGHVADLGAEVADMEETPDPRPIDQLRVRGSLQPWAIANVMRTTH